MNVDRKGVSVSFIHMKCVTGWLPISTNIFLNCNHLHCICSNVVNIHVHQTNLRWTTKDCLKWNTGWLKTPWVGVVFLRDFTFAPMRWKIEAQYRYIHRFIHIGKNWLQKILHKKSSSVSLQKRKRPWYSFRINRKIDISAPLSLF